MTIKERIKILLGSGEIGNVTLAAVLLQSIPSLEEQIKLFEAMCDRETQDHEVFVTTKYLFIMSWHSTMNCFNVIGQNWTLYYNGGIYMLKNPHNPGLYKEIVI